ncbi:Nitrogenase FeMo-cofactor synthesis FeS core scaffold and assembly protein NifB [hydrothermal vent metagenome]|uniref:Nitrogenase FeMo-cofactor synthesis FeS core scaffold and assembly protein NifB n=1 Tax=hydrothermal vent metagenome TaxID=652676 RepID=A0A3B0VNV1_9ZZZZ
MTILPFPEKATPGGEPMQVDCLILPVAPRANSRIRFADNEKPNQAMLPAEAISWIGEMSKGNKRIHAVDINGPGDALASPGPTMETLDLLRSTYPEIEIRVATLGFNTPQLAGTLAAKGVRQVNLLVDAIDPEIVKKIYAWIRPGKKTIPLLMAADILIDGQQKAIALLREAGLKVNVQTTVYPGINDRHVESIAEQLAAAGAESITLVPFKPGTTGEDAPPSCDESMLAAVRKNVAGYLEVCEYSEESIVPPAGGNLQKSGALLPKPSKERPNIAVVSSNGMDIDLHLGQADQVLIYGPREDGLACLLEARPAPVAGGGDNRWKKLAEECLFDCCALLTANAGDNPQKVLAAQGVKVLISEENIEGTVDVLYGGGKKKKGNR